jgi:peptide chain release factor 3
LGDFADDVIEELELVKGATHQFEMDEFLAGKLTPVFFGTALGNFGVRELLDDFVRWAPPPQPREAKQREVLASDAKSSAALYLRFKLIWTLSTATVLPLCVSVQGTYTKGMKMKHVRTGKDMRVSDAFSFKAGERISVRASGSRRYYWSA